MTRRRDKGRPRVFPFTRLPAELRLEIIGFAACSPLDGYSWRVASCYATAVALCSVSHSVRQATMPHLLRTVILRSSDDISSFVDAIVQQQLLQKTSSRLAIDYTKHVRRLWASGYLSCRLDCSGLYQVIRNVWSFGVHVHSQELLYNASRSSPEDWTCRRLTFAGRYWVWNTLTSTPDGLACLRQVTHLVLWFEDTRNYTKLMEEYGPLVAPAYLAYVPFHLMPSLTHFAFGIDLGRRPKPDSETCRRWIVENHPNHPEYGEFVKDLVIRPLMMIMAESVLESEFLNAKNEEIWQDRDL